jgi:Domain of unknown function (DUF3825)
MNKRWQIFEPKANAWTGLMDTNEVARQVISGRFGLEQQARDAATWATLKVGSISLLEAAIGSLKQGGAGVEIPASPERLGSLVNDPKEDRSPKTQLRAASPDFTKPRTISPEEAPFYAELDRLEAKRIEEGNTRAKKNTTPGSLLTSWALIALWPTTNRRTKEIREPVLASLKEKAIDEDWCFPTDEDKYTILRSYLQYTFYRLFRERKIAFSGRHASFNTGLSDCYYEPIYAVFKRNADGAREPYRFAGFCVAGEEDLGKEFIRKFPYDLRPAAASYLSEFKDVVVKPGVKITYQWSHIIRDGVSRGRFPVAFLIKNAPKQIPPFFPNQPIAGWLETYAKILMSNRDAQSDFGEVIELKVKQALQRVGWNYKAAIPNYFATSNRMSILLPLCLVERSVVDMALVISPVEGGEREWYALTVYTLDMAYNNARVVSKPMSDWLLVDKIIPAQISEGPIESESE